MATITTWLKSVGDSVEAEESIVEIATDKVDSEVPSPADGVITQILFEEGSVPQVGDVIAIITSGGLISIDLCRKIASLCSTSFGHTSTWNNLQSSELHGDQVPSEIVRTRRKSSLWSNFDFRQTSPTTASVLPSAIRFRQRHRRLGKGTTKKHLVLSVEFNFISMQ